MSGGLRQWPFLRAPVGTLAEPAGDGESGKFGLALPTHGTMVLWGHREPVTENHLLKLPVNVARAKHFDNYIGSTLPILVDSPRFLRRRVALESVGRT